ncbi:MAG: hypothetical protein AAGF49_11590, partial [Pseudomonadota bacterium]
LVEVFQNPTVASLAARMAEGEGESLAADFEEIDARAARTRTLRRKRAHARNPDDPPAGQQS